MGFFIFRCFSVVFIRKSTKWGLGSSFSYEEHRCQIQNTIFTWKAGAFQCFQVLFSALRCFSHEKGHFSWKGLSPSIGLSITKDQKAAYSCRWLQSAIFQFRLTLIAMVYLFQFLKPRRVEYTGVPQTPISTVCYVRAFG